MSAPTPVWRPDPDLVAGSANARFTTHLSRRHGLSFENYSQLWRWSVDHLEEFWAEVWDFFDVQAEGRPEPVLADSAMPGARRFPGTRLNYAQHALRHGDQPSTRDTVAVTAIDKSGDTTTRVATSTCPVAHLGSLVIGAELADGGYWLVLFAVPADGTDFSAEPGGGNQGGDCGEGVTTTRARRRHRRPCPAPHSDRKAAGGPVKRLIQGHSLNKVVSRDAVDDFAALAQFTAYARPRLSQPASSSSQACRPPRSA